jgi:hypothetical protein
MPKLLSGSLPATVRIVSGLLNLPFLLMAPATFRDTRRDYRMAGSRRVMLSAPILYPNMFGHD